MPVAILGSVGATQHKAVTSTSGKFAKTSAHGSSTFRVYSNRNCHLSVGNAATTSDFPIPANWPVDVWVEHESEVNFILATGETDGDIWMTQVQA